MERQRHFLPYQPRRAVPYINFLWHDSIAYAKASVCTLTAFEVQHLFKKSISFRSEHFAHPPYNEIFADTLPHPHYR